MNDLVSVIMPVYNSELYLLESINSVLNQTYRNIELICVNDKSTDSSRDIIINLRENDRRICLIDLESNSGAAIARNKGLEAASGTFIAFLDSDDYWDTDKLRIQIEFMNNNDIIFSYTDYVKRIDNGQTKIHKSPYKLDYRGLLKKCPGNSTVVYNCTKVGKVFATNIKKRNDFVMWLSLIKRTEYAYGIGEPLTIYNIRSGSLSNNKKSLIKYQWKVYRDIEKLSIPYSLYLTIYKVFQGLFETFKPYK